MAKIDLIISDQGTGGAYCSACGKSLDNGNPRITIPPTCPFCNSDFEGYETFLNRGGCDF